jgi:hypothetical protein
MEDDEHRCLYVGTSWEVEVVTDRRDVDEFKRRHARSGMYYR